MAIEGFEISDDKWIISEKVFNQHYLGKCEVLMALGNGYMGMRSTTEEKYLNEVRDTFIAGTFDKADDNEVCELPNVPDFSAIDFKINGTSFSLLNGTILTYDRSFNLKSGELSRSIKWEDSNSNAYLIESRRFCSNDDLHLFCQTYSITPLDDDLSLGIKSGINGQVTNSGAQHFIEGDKRFFDKTIMHQEQLTRQSKLNIVINTMHSSFINGKQVQLDLTIAMDRRMIFGTTSFNINKGSKFTFQKYTVLGSTRDKNYEDGDKLNSFLLKKIESYINVPYETLLKESAKMLNDKVYNKALINIESEDPFDQLSSRFAQYHLHIMMPQNDNRMGIGAKGFTGEGYKGHSFWDTEIFIFPYFLFMQPKIARSLLEYRYQTLPGAREKARNNGYKGAQFPWESAWIDDGEVTPIWGAADIITGKPIKIYSGFIEQHITSDIAFSVYRYYCATKDEDFMEKYGYQILFETATFWASRVETGEDGKYHINCVIGPDEYKEHINDNAFTNYLAELNLELAIKFANKLSTNNSSLYKKLDKEINIEEEIKNWIKVKDNLLIPTEGDNHIIPQDSTYLNKKIIDLSKYKNQEHVGLIFDDYNLEQVNDIQVSKQADIMMLFYLRESLFSKEVKKANWHYYEPKTLHDSSLSFSTHAIIANDLGEYKLSHELYKKCREIDLGPNMISSDNGIHAASLGGLLQVILNGFGGIRILGDKLRIQPNLPSNWSKLQYVFMWHGTSLGVEITKQELKITREIDNEEDIDFVCFDRNYSLKDSITIKL
jgi:hypothetical glycosyl hydrolase